MKRLIRVAGWLLAMGCLLPPKPCTAEVPGLGTRTDDYGSDTLLDRGRKAVRERFRKEERADDRHDVDMDMGAPGMADGAGGYGVSYLHASVDDFSGDQYKPEEFLDLNLGAPNFRDIKDAAERRPLKDDAGVKDVHAVGPDAGDDTAAMTADERDELEPIENNLLDWVPSPPDRLNNGGFGLGADNGAPVPYTLNGHVGIERGYPWDPSM